MGKKRVGGEELVTVSIDTLLKNIALKRMNVMGSSSCGGMGLIF